MKKSNRLLVAGFLLVVLLISAIHISLYAKYKSGNYALYNIRNDLPPESVQSFPNILFVSVSNVAGATVVFSNVAQVEKDEENNIRYTQKGDTLLIVGKDDINQGMRTYVTLRLPHNAKLSVINSSLSFATDNKLTDASPVIRLEKSAALFSSDRNPLCLRNVKLVALDSSAATFQGNTQVANLDVQLSRSSIEYGDGKLGALPIITDSLSRIALQSNHLAKANIKTVTP